VLDMIDTAARQKQVGGGGGVRATLWSESKWVAVAGGG
jgi:hypothetical protein